MTDKPLTRCRECGGRLEKLWSPTSFQFKGTGWYVTDYAGKKADPGEEKKSTPSDAAANTSDKATATEKTKKKSTETKTASSSTTNGD
jgi:predicted nucleic acid-binding Zn ribbon protein